MKSLKQTTYFEHIFGFKECVTREQRCVVWRALSLIAVRRNILKQHAQGVEQKFLSEIKNVFVPRCEPIGPMVKELRYYIESQRCRVAHEAYFIIIKDLATTAGFPEVQNLTMGGCGYYRPQLDDDAMYRHIVSYCDQVLKEHTYTVKQLEKMVDSKTHM